MAAHYRWLRDTELPQVLAWSQSWAVFTHPAATRRPEQPQAILAAQ